MLISLTRLIDM